MTGVRVHFISNSDASMIDQQADITKDKKKLINNVYIYCLKFDNRITKNEVKEKIKKLNIMRYTSPVIELLEEQYEIYEISEELNGDQGCKITKIEVSHQGIPFGSIYTFFNEKNRFMNERYLGIQGIVKYIVPTIAGVIYPEFNIPKLNACLEAPIEEIARKYKCHNILVSPIYNQGNILLKYYGYKDVGEEIVKDLCNIMAHTDITLYKPIPLEDF